MKDSRFIELVNLYIDRQISPAEQAELELEIQSDPRRREVYQQYCRMHRATKLVYESFRKDADQQPAPVRQPATIAYIAGRARQRRLRWVYAAGSLAAAACLALVFVRLDHTPAETGAPALAAVQPAAQPSPALAVNQPAPEAVKAVEVADAGLKPIDLRRAHSAEADFAATVAAFRAEQERLISNANNRPATLSLFEDDVFDARSTLPVRQNQNARRQQQRVPTEFTAFQFQR